MKRIMLCAIVVAIITAMLAQPVAADMTPPQAPYIIRGTVTLAIGEPAQGALVTITNTTGQSSYQLTDANGRYAISIAHYTNGEILEVKAVLGDAVATEHIRVSLNENGMQSSIPDTVDLRFEEPTSILIPLLIAAAVAAAAIAYLLFFLHKKKKADEEKRMEEERKRKNAKRRQRDKRGKYRKK